MPNHIVIWVVKSGFKTMCGKGIYPDSVLLFAKQKEEKEITMNPYRFRVSINGDVTKFEDIVNMLKESKLGFIYDVAKYHALRQLAVRDF